MLKEKNMGLLFSLVQVQLKLNAFVDTVGHDYG